MGLFDHIIPFNNQDYTNLKQECLERDMLFVDSSFPPDIKSLFMLGMPESLDVVWKRPSELCDMPSLCIETSSSNEMTQGQLGNHWFVAACGSILAHKDSWNRVVPDYKKQEWQPALIREGDEAIAVNRRSVNYAGIFKFRFWRYGDWIEVVVDDYLPCSATDGKPLFCHSTFRNEFWTCLLEKAFAKLNGSYENLSQIEMSDALVQFTGGTCEIVSFFDYVDEPLGYQNLFKLLSEEASRGSIMVTGIESMTINDMDRVIPETGLTVGHPYPITSVRTIATQKHSVRSIFGLERRPIVNMIRLRNAWGGAAGGWRGAFSEGSVEWDAIDRETRQSIGLTFEDDAEFWIPIEDITANMTNIIICRQPISWAVPVFKQGWRESQFHGVWNSHLSGGCLNNKDTFLTNPQYMLEINGGNAGDLMDEVVICLTQKTSGNSASDLMHIGFTVLRIEGNRLYRAHKLENCNVIQSSAFKNSRSAFLRLSLNHGRYIVIPCTYQSQQEGQYLLRILWLRPCQPHELVHDRPPTAGCFCQKYPEMVTRITIRRAEGLDRIPALFMPFIGALGAQTLAPDVYCLLECEGQKGQTALIPASSDPEWNESFIFYRRQPIKIPITVSIFHKGKVSDDLLGRQVFSMLENNEGREIESDLMGKDNAKERFTRRPGRLILEMSSTTDFLKL